MAPLNSMKYGVAALCTVISLTACTVGPDYVRPGTQTPVAFKENEGWKVAQPKDSINRGAWWEVFNDPKLNELEQQVDISNQNLAAAEAQFRQAVAAVQASRAAYFPTAAAGTSASRSRQSANLAGARGSSSPVNDFQLTGTASWELDLWGKVRRTVEASKASAQASAADLELARLSAQAQLAQDYLQLRTLDELKDLLDTTVGTYQTFLDLTKNRYASGIASRSDVLQAETQLKAAQAQSVETGVQRAQMEHAIALLLGKPASEFSIPPAKMTAVLPSIPAGLPSELLERRPDIAAAERLVASANAQIGVAEAAYYPTLTLNASGGFEASDIAKWFSWPSRLWALGPAVLQDTIFDAGLRRAQTEQARAAYDANVANYRQTVLTAFQEVEDNLSTLRILEQEMQVEEEAVRAAKESLSVTTNRYKAGIASALDVIVTQNIALSNEVTAVNLHGRRLAASVLLIQAIGGGWSASELPSLDSTKKVKQP